MRKIIFALLLVLVLAPVVFASDVKINSFVNDYAGVLSQQDKLELERILKEVYDSGAAQYSIVVVKSLEGKAIESYALELAQGRLGDSEKNNGLLLLVAIDDRKYRFEVGRGIEDVLNDAKVGRIGRNYLVENFRAGNYGLGMIEASKAVRSVLLGDKDSLYYVDDSLAGSNRIIWIYVAGFFVLIIFLNLLSFSRRVRSNDKYFSAASGAVILFGGRGGSCDGGFGGFGGGSFGGGGASGGW